MEMTMKTQSTLAAAVLFTCFAASAFGGEQGTINQANPLDATMRFYMHPAHLYLSNEPPHSFGEHPAVLVKRSEARINSADTPAIRPHPALLGRSAQAPKIAQSKPAPVYP
jgi:hypothetical protein